LAAVEHLSHLAKVLIYTDQAADNHFTQVLNSRAQSVAAILRQLEMNL
jgi:hypothetical protein